MTNSITATLVGGPTLAFNYGTLSVLIDPTFDEPGDYPSGGITLRKLVGPAVDPDDLDGVDLVLLSHDQHADNLDNAGREFLATVETVLSTTDAQVRIDGVIGLEPWQSRVVGAVTVTAVPAEHGPEGAEELSGMVIGFVLEADGWPTTYVTGDNASILFVERIADRFIDIRLAIVFAGAANVGRFGPANVTFDAAQVSRVAELLPGAQLVLAHFSDWAHFTQSGQEVIDEFATDGRSERLTVPARGEPVVVWSA